jgi:UDP-glucose 4-epimerase
VARRFLVTGGAGYIGANVIALLRARGDEVVAFDDLSSGRPERLTRLEVPLVRGDVRDGAALEAALIRPTRCDGVLHFAAKKQVGESVEKPLLYYDVNVGGTQALLAAVAHAGVPALVYSSSAAVYGDGGPAARDHQPVGEDTSCRPLSPYGETKLVGEWMAERAAAAHRITVIALRYFNVAGAPAEPFLADFECLNLIPIALRAARAGRPLEVFGRAYPTRDGTGVRDYVHVSDLAEAHIHAMDALLAGKGGGVFNVGTGHGASVLEVAEAVRRASGLALQTVDAPARAGDPAELVADVSRIDRVLGWTARRTSIDEIVGSAFRAGVGV